MIPADMMAAIAYQHPHIAARIQATWGDPLCASYMSDLIVPSRGGHQGFNEAASGALVGLIELHDSLYPPRHDIWGAAA